MILPGMIASKEVADPRTRQPLSLVAAEELDRFLDRHLPLGLTLRSLCTQHGIGLKITAQVLKARHGIRAGASDEVDPFLIADLAPKLKDLINAQDAARHLCISVYLLRWLMADGLLVPEYRFNDRMVGFRPGKLDAFLNTVRDVAEIMEVARSGIVGVSRGDKIMR